MKKALITGARDGIGRATAKQLASSGIFVIGTSHTDVGVKILQEQDHISAAYKLPLNHLGEMSDLVSLIFEEQQDIHILINNAATLQLAGFFEITEDIWDETLNVNLKSLFFLSQAMARHMRDRALEGVIINIDSLASQFGFVDQAPYSASKAAVHILTRVMARELSAAGIRVHGVRPGAIDTMMFNQLVQWSSKKYEISETSLLNAWLGNTVNRLPINAETVANVICHLVLEGDMSLSGCCWSVDSGVS